MADFARLTTAVTNLEATVQQPIDKLNAGATDQTTLDNAAQSIETATTALANAIAPASVN